MTIEAGTDRLHRLDDEARAALFLDARTANTFSDEPVSDEQLRDVWELARWAPTAANMQPLRVLFVRPGAGRERLVELMADGNKEKTAAAPAVAVLATDTRFHEHVPTIFPIRPEMQDVLEQDEAMRAGMGSQNAWLQAGYLILAVRAVGLAAGPMAGFDRAGVDAAFFPGGRLQSQLVVNIGHPGPEAWFPRLPRLEHDQTVSWA
ncbi:malonic semialdehyde reductase [Angustibacter aerolatus]